MRPHGYGEVEQVAGVDGRTGKIDTDRAEQFLVHWRATDCGRGDGVIDGAAVAVGVAVTVAVGAVVAVRVAVLAGKTVAVGVAAGCAPLSSSSPHADTSMQVTTTAATIRALRNLVMCLPSVRWRALSASSVR